MGLLSILGGVVGSIIPGVGTAIGAGLGTALEGGIKAVSGGSKASSSQPQYIQLPEKQSLDDLRSAQSKTGMDILKTPTAKAEAAKVPGIKNDPGILEDPWQPMREWYDDLGGDSKKLRPIDDTRL